MRVLRAFLESTAHPRILIFGAMRDKAVAEMAEIIVPAVDAVVLTQPSHRRAATPQALKELSAHLTEYLYLRPTPEESMDLAVRLAGPEGTVVAAGSLFLVGDLSHLAIS